MKKRKIGIFLRIVIVCFLAIIAMGFIGRNHFIFGTMLILGRWGFIIFGLFLLYRTTKRTIPKYYQISLIFSLTLVFLEFVWNKVNEHTLHNTSTNTEVSFMTYNLFFKNRNPNASIEKIKTANPDILVVQELTPDWNNRLNNSVGVHYSHKSTLALRGTHGIGIYSKYPISKNHILPNNSKFPFAQVVEIEINSKKIQLVNVHLASPAIAVENPHNFLPLLAANYESRSNQLQKINLLMQEGKYDAQVLIGDLNTTKYEPLYRNMKCDWVDLFNISGVGSQLSFPNSSKTDPILTLDYIFVRGNLTGIETRVVEGGSSDHLAIIGKVGI